MFVRSRVTQGVTYYAVVESYRDGGKDRHWQVPALSTSPDLEHATAETWCRLRRLRTVAGEYVIHLRPLGPDEGLLGQDLIVTAAFERRPRRAGSQRNRNGESKRIGREIRSA